jgi:hypothetical protein
MTTVSAPPRMRLRSPEDVLAATPYFLGFHPSDSLVVLGLTGTSLKFHVRGDLPPIDASQKVLTEFGDQFGDLMQEHGIDAVVLVGYGTEPIVTPTVMAVQHAMSRRQIDVRDMLRTSDGLYWSYVCKDPVCCPPEGTPFDVTNTVVAASATVAGCVAMPDRDTVVRSLDPPVGLALVAIQQATERAACRLIPMFNQADGKNAVQAAGKQALTEALECYRGPGRLSDDDLGWLCVLMQTGEFRDVAWRGADAADRDERAVHVRLWTDVVHRSDPDYVAHPAALLSFVLWRGGDGIRAAVAVERALDADPRHLSAQVMSEILQRGLPPSMIDRPPQQPAREHARRRRRR